MKNVIVIGAGASGLMAAITAANNGANVTVLEHKECAGKKILQTGNGRCNLTNEYMDEKCYQNPDTFFVMNVIKKFNVNDTIDFFNSIGVLTKIRQGYVGNDGNERYVYPNSDQASTVLNALLIECKNKDVDIEYNINVLNIKKDKDTKRFTVITCRDDNEVKYTCDSIIISTGSKAAYITGSDGSGYELAKSIGHKIVKPLPALVPLTSPDEICKDLAGVRNESVIAAYCCDEKVVPFAVAKGEVQFTDYGISGIPVFQISRHVTYLLNKKKKIIVSIDLLPKFSEQDLTYFFKKIKENNKNMLFADFLCGMINAKIGKMLCKRCGIGKKQIIDNVTENDLIIVISEIKHFEMVIDGDKGFDRAQICSGGVSLDEIDMATMQSRVCSGVYFAGEILDVDGICGGYNLQWAWSSGHLAGEWASK